MKKTTGLSASSSVQVVHELMPGDLALGFAGDRFKTLLGSCVSVILTDPRRTVGSMCHIVHVSRPNKDNTHNTAFGVVAMHEMFRLLRSVGIVPQLCHAFVYGGGNMFPDQVTVGSVGEKNAHWALRYLKEHDIQVLDFALEGAGYRKVSWTVGEDPLVEMVMVQPGAVDVR